LHWAASQLAFNLFELELFCLIPILRIPFEQVSHSFNASLVQALLGIGVGRLSDAQLDTVVEHVQACDACWAAFRARSPESRTADASQTPAGTEGVLDYLVSEIERVVDATFTATEVVPTPDDLEMDLGAGETPDDWQEQRRAKMEEVHLLLEQELSGLGFRDKGELAAYWIDRDHTPSSTAAKLLQLTAAAARVAKWTALSAHPCGDTRGTCQGRSGCAHSRGAELWNSIATRISNTVHVHRPGYKAPIAQATQASADMVESTRVGYVSSRRHA